MAKPILRIAVAGAAGKMGQMLIQAISQDPMARLTGALEHSASPALGRDAGAPLGLTTQVIISADADQALANADYLIDFTRPEATLQHLVWAAQRNIKMVIGTTGFDAAGKAQIQAHAAKIATVFSANMSVGVTATVKILELAAKILDHGFDVEIIESHHRHKVDAPSGTALLMGETIAKATERSLEQHGVFARQGVTGPREARSIGFSVVRGGDIVGEHTVLFAGTGEQIEITHKSNSRMTYAVGAVRACHYLSGQTKGLFDMKAVLGLS